jgi:hypothetical protein
MADQRDTGDEVPEKTELKVGRINLSSNERIVPRRYADAGDGEPLSKSYAIQEAKKQALKEATDVYDRAKTRIAYRSARYRR